MQKKTKKKQKWVRFRHKVITKIAYCVLYPYLRLKYHITIEKFKQQENRPYLVLFNHQTALDQFIVGPLSRARFITLPVKTCFPTALFLVCWNGRLRRFPLRSRQQMRAPC